MTGKCVRDGWLEKPSISFISSDFTFALSQSGCDYLCVTSSRKAKEPFSEGFEAYEMSSEGDHQRAGQCVCVRVRGWRGRPGFWDGGMNFPFPIASCSTMHLVVGHDDDCMEAGAIQTSLFTWRSIVSRWSSPCDLCFSLSGNCCA